MNFANYFLIKFISVPWFVLVGMNDVNALNMDGKLICQEIILLCDEVPWPDSIGADVEGNPFIIELEVAGGPT